jgi:hypothetical protein
MGKKLIPFVLLGSALALSGQVSLGIRIGPPPPPRVMAVRPAAPGPGFVWVDGYWYPSGGRYRWHEGYWTRPPYEGARWVGPHHDGDRFFNGYWEGGHGRVEHDHKWDSGHDRDYHHEGRDEHHDDHDRH